MELKTPQDYIQAALRRKWWIIIPFVVSIALAFGAYKKLPKIYKATTLILVEPQKVPEHYVKPTVRSLVSDRLSTLSQQILSRTRLERVIGEFSLYPDLVGKMTMEEVVEVMRKAIEVEVRRVGGPDTFTISYQGKEPRKVMLVTNRLASLFIEENLKARERQAAGTSEFLERELRSIEVALRSKEKEIRAFKERHMGELPEQLDANLRMLQRLQDQIKNNNDARKMAEEKRVLLQTRLSELSSEKIRVTDGEVLDGNPSVSELNRLKVRLKEIRPIYTDKHPDVIDIKAQIAELEKEVLQRVGVNKDANSQAGTPVFNPLGAGLNEEIAEIEMEIGRSKVEAEFLRTQTTVYQMRVEDTPKREQELATLTRDYDLMKANYQSLLDKRNQAKLAENLERRQKGEQFKILDPARIPETPWKPDRNKTILMGSLLGLALGAGLAYLKETMDRSFYKADEVERFLGFRVIATIPRIKAGKAERSFYCSIPLSKAAE